MNKNSEVRHIPIDEYDGDKRSPELEELWAKAVALHNKDGTVHPAVSKLKFKNDIKPEWVEDFCEWKIRKCYNDYSYLAGLEERLKEIEGEMFKLESVPMYGGNQNYRPSEHEIARAQNYHVSALRRLEVWKKNLISSIVKMRTKLGC